MNDEQFLKAVERRIVRHQRFNDALFSALIALCFATLASLLPIGELIQMAKSVNPVTLSGVTGALLFAGWLCLSPQAEW